MEGIDFPEEKKHLSMFFVSKTQLYHRRVLQFKKARCVTDNYLVRESLPWQFDNGIVD